MLFDYFISSLCDTCTVTVCLFLEKFSCVIIGSVLVSLSHENLMRFHCLI